MKKKVRCFLNNKVRALCIFIFFTAPCFAQGVSSTDLIKNAKAYDNTTVIFQGEVIGDVMARGPYAWVNINDGKGAIGAWMKKDTSRLIHYTGAFQTRGDRVEVTGAFHRSCPEHGGDLDIHAETLRIIAPGNNLAEEPRIAKAKLAVGLAIILGVVWISSIVSKR